MATYNIKKQAQVYVYPTIDIERGMTVSETHAANTEIGATGAFATTPRGQKVFMAGEVVLPSSFSNTEECLFEHGGSGSGNWIGVKTIDSVLTFQMRMGSGTAGSTATNNDRVVENIAVSSVPEFDGKMHTVAWEYDPPNGTAKLWIDNRLVLSGVSLDGTTNPWSGSNVGGWLQGFAGIAGYTDNSQDSIDHRRAWSGAAGSDLRVYTNQTLTYSNTPVLLDVTEDINFTQTFTDQTFTKRTIHELNKVFDESNIKKANPANFEFTIPALVEDDLQIIMDLLVDYDASGHNLNTFDLYIKLPNDVYRLQNCVITNGTFIIEKLENLKLSIQGQASRLTRGETFPGNAGSRSSSRTFQIPEYLSVSVGGTSLTAGIYLISVELQNDIKWIPYETVNDALSVTNADTTMYPSNFTLEKRILSGSIGQYVQSDFNSDVQTWENNVTIDIKAGNDANFNNGFRFENLQNCTFTNRNVIEEVFTQRYDWKMNDNPADLGTKIKFNNN